MSTRFDDVLNDCLERMAAGENVRHCIERYPEHEEELAPLLSVAKVTMQAIGSTPYTPATKARVMARMNRAIVNRKQPSRRRFSSFFSNPIARPVMLGFTAVFFLLIAAGGTTVASSDSVPGDPLYWVKTTRENVALKMSRSEVDKARVHVALANERSREIQVLIVRGQFQDAEYAMKRLRQHLNQSASHVGLIIPVNPVEMPIKSIQFNTSPSTVSLVQSLERDETIMRRRMAKLLQEMPEHQQRRIRRIMHQSELGYQILLEALDDRNRAGQRPFVNLQSFAVPTR